MNHNHTVPKSQEALTPDDTPDQEPVVYEYPFPSEVAEQAREARAKGLKPDEWHEPRKGIDEVLHQIRGPILELGGPSELGYYFLEGQALPSRPIISNVMPDSQKYSPNREQLNSLTDLIIDGRNLENVPDDSLGAVLTSYLSEVDGDETKAQRDRVVTLMEDAANIGEISTELMETSLRLKIAKEVFQKLEPGGLYFTDTSPEELKVQELLGFTSVAVYDRNSTDETNSTQRYYVVFQKPPTGS